MKGANKNKMTLYNIIFSSGGIIIIFLTIIQVTPIKLNPWSWIVKKIGAAFNKDLFNEITKINNTIESLEIDIRNLRNEYEEKEIINARVRILRFGDTLSHGMKPSKEHYNQILNDIDQYEKYCSSHKGFENSVATMTISKIKKSYQKNLEDDNFME